MALPFMMKKMKSIPAVSTEMRAPDQEPAPEDAGLEAAASDLMSAVQAGDAKGVASALRAAFDIIESMPHEEPAEEEASMPEGEE